MIRFTSSAGFRTCSGQTRKRRRGGRLMRRSRSSTASAGRSGWSGGAQRNRRSARSARKRRMEIMARKKVETPKNIPNANEDQPRKRVNPPLRPKQKGDYTYKIPLAQLTELCSIQCTDEEIAAVFGCRKDVIEQRKKDPEFLQAYQAGKAKGRISLRRQLHKSCKDGNVSAQIWMSKQILGMRDVTALEHSGPQGASIESVTTVRIEYVDDDEKNVDSDD